MDLNIFFDATGRLHPALVHLPIGILVISSGMELLSRNGRLEIFRPAIRTLVFWGMLASVLAVATGLALHENGSYEEELLDPHEWAGISVAVSAIVLYILYRLQAANRSIKLMTLALVALLFLTGHLGGNLTHGPDFLTAPFQSDKGGPALEPIPDIDQALAYQDVVQPLMQVRCYNCHSDRKQKGDLRVDSREYLLTGGENGAALVPGKPEESLMIERLLLPLEHEDHMPPKGKPQLTPEEISFLKWWVSSGADFHKKIGELNPGASVKPALLALQTGTTQSMTEPMDLPEKNVAPADPALIKKLTDAGVMIVPLSLESNYLQANFVTATGSIDTLLEMMAPLREQLLVIKLDELHPGDSALMKLASFTALRDLQLTNATVTETQIAGLSALTELRTLNLTGSSVNGQALASLKDLKNLKKIYLYKTNVSESERSALQQLFPETALIYGNFRLPMLATDTTELEIK